MTTTTATTTQTTTSMKQWTMATLTPPHAQVHYYTTTLVHCSLNALLRYQAITRLQLHYYINMDDYITTHTTLLHCYTATLLQSYAATRLHYSTSTLIHLKIMMMMVWMMMLMVTMMSLMMLMHFCTKRRSPYMRSCANPSFFAHNKASAALVTEVPFLGGFSSGAQRRRPRLTRLVLEPQLLDVLF